jgi:hypothetical protein
MSRLDRVSTSKAATIIIVAGLVLFGCAVLAGVLTAWSNNYSFSPNGGDPALKDRLLTFFQAALLTMIWAVLVVAAGFALRAFGERPSGQTPDASAPPIPFEDVPVRLPAGEPITIDVVQGPADDEVWRR